MKIMTHVIFGINAPHPKDKLNLTLNPPSTYARRHPLYVHPSKAVSKDIPRTWKFRPHIKWAEDLDILARNTVDSPTRTHSSTIGGGGLEWAAWSGFTDKDERITNPSLAFLVDIFMNTPALLPKSEKIGLKHRYLFCCTYGHFASLLTTILQLVSDCGFVNRIQKQDSSPFISTCRPYSWSVFLWSFHDCTSRKT